jgi:glycogen debranching enzyme
MVIRCVLLRKPTNGFIVNPAQARQFLEPIAHHLLTHGLGTCSEIFDGDAPMTPRGCIAQAWTVAEVLRAWVATEQA